MSQPTLNEKPSDFWVGWDSALEAMDVEVTRILIDSTILRSKPMDVLLDCRNAIKELRETKI